MEVLHSVRVGMSLQSNNREKLNMNGQKNTCLRIVAMLLALSLLACGGTPKKPGFNQKEIDKRQSDSFQELDRT